LYVSGTEIAILTSTATSRLETDEQALETMRKEMVKQIEEIKIK